MNTRQEQVRDKVRNLVATGVAILVFGPLVLALAGNIVKWLWNWLVPPLFGLPALTFWQAAGLLALCRILFGGNGVMGGRRSPEERARFRRGWNRRFGLDEKDEVPL